MANLNKVFILGNLTRDPELRHTAGGTPVASFSLAVNRKYKAGEDWKTEVSYFNVIVWSKLGENCCKYLTKGKAALVEGRLQNRSYETQDGQKRSVTEIIAENVQFLGGGRGESTGDTSDAGEGHDGQLGDDDRVPF